MSLHPGHEARIAAPNTRTDAGVVHRETGVSKSVGPRQAIASATLESLAGESPAIVGGNGSGKSTLREDTRRRAPPGCGPGRSRAGAAHRARQSPGGSTCRQSDRFQEALLVVRATGSNHARTHGARPPPRGGKASSCRPCQTPSTALDELGLPRPLRGRLTLGLGIWQHQRFVSAISVAVRHGIGSPG